MRDVRDARPLGRPYDSDARAGRIDFNCARKILWMRMDGFAGWVGERVYRIPSSFLRACSLKP
jgi:hypothetical protein